MKNKTPMQIVNEKFGSRDDLVKKILSLVGEKSGGDMHSSLNATTNSKLLKLHSTANLINKKFGSRKKMIDSIVKIDFKDRKPEPEYVERLDSYPIKKLYFLHEQKAK